MKKYAAVLFIAVLLLTTLACVLPTIPFLDRSEEEAPVTSSTPVVIVPTVPSPILPTSFTDLSERDALLTALYQNVNPGVVTIINYNDLGGGSGSGFVFDRDGHIVTNYHVIEGADLLEVDFPSGLKVWADLVGTDLDSDLAVLKVDVPADQLRPLALADPATIMVGQTVIAIGNPFSLNSTMTIGIISAKGRVLDSLRESGTGGYFSAGDMIQTDAAINPGNSGGPLLNLNGEVVGINRAIYTEATNITEQPVNSGIGFAISVSIVRNVVPEIIAKGFYDYPYIGITSREQLSLQEIEALGLPQTTGAYVIDVADGGPADKAGIQAGQTPTEFAGLESGGDLIIAIDGQPVNVFGDLIAYLVVNKQPGDQVTLTILRDGETKEVTVTLAKRP
ncbi:MAG TPA: trypsin-like peptidase domain-containing protein [Anaerolineaceae bacterium]|nr:trypsin-like peptidase domain-containing protein [Anaerolineaceae bacterium]